MADVAADDRVSGSAEIMKQAAAGMALFKSDAAEVEGDVAAATAYKAEIDAKHTQLEAEAAALTGKDNKKARSEKSKEASALKKSNEYIDAERVVKGLAPKHGHFLKAGQAMPTKAAPVEAAPATDADAHPAQAAAAAEKKDDKKKDTKKKAENAGISPAERQELEKLKGDIIARKGTLKESGMSGGQINKDPEIVAWVARMNELKEKECPGSTTAGKDDKKKDKKKVLSSEAAKEVETFEKEIEEYRTKLKTEFGYSNKDINADPDMVDMQAKLKQLKK